MAKILIKGAGVVGLITAWVLRKVGYDITIAAPQESPIGSASWYAGGMLAPFCERESSSEEVENLGIAGLGWWKSNFPDLVESKGTIVVAQPRDRAELLRFANATNSHQHLDEAELRELEPELEKFSEALYYEQEAHIDPRIALIEIKNRLKSQNVRFIEPSSDEKHYEYIYDYIIDCTGKFQIGKISGLRAVRGEMLLLHCPEIHLNRTIRLLHPRIPLYIVPRTNNIFMIGATMIESDSESAISVRSMTEFLNAAFAIHPAFASATIIESGVDLRPSFPDNFPQIIKDDNIYYINGMYRHGYLLAPYFAEQIAEKIFKTC